MHIHSLNLSLNFKPRFENLKPRFKNLNIGLKEKVYINSLWGCLRFVIVVFPDHTHLLFLKFQTGVLAGQMHINSLNLRLSFKPRFKKS